jgi:asparagine synthase (glutamine-hydrolysing)
LINPEFAKRIGLRDRREALQPLQLTPPGIARKRHYRDLIAGEIPLGLEISNKIASAFSLEARYPFADRRLAEFCLGIPAGERIQDGWSRMFVRRALANCLPEKVCWRAGKGDLSHNLRQSLLKFEEQRLDEVFFGGSRQIEPYLALEQLRGAYRSYKERPDTGSIQAVWCAANLALWLERATQREKFPLHSHGNLLF